MHYLIILALLMLTGCGSGNSDPTSPQATPTTISAEGIWMGTTGSGRTVAGVVLNDGTYWFLYSGVGTAPVAGVVHGTGSVQGDAFTSSNTRDLNLEGLGVLDATLAGTVVTRQHLSGTVNYVHGGSTTFSTTYNAEYEGVPTVDQVVGTYSGPVTNTGGVDWVTVTLTAPGTLAGSSTGGCSVTGFFTPRSHGNIYDVSITFAGVLCANGTSTVTGEAFLDAATHRLVSAALNPTRTNGFLFIGLRVGA